MRFNTAKEKMLQGKPVIGGSSGLGSPLSAETLALAGLDLVLIDDQHGVWDPQSMMAAFRSVRLAGAVPLGRVGKNDYYAIGSMLDRGALGIVVPMVHTAEDARAAVYAARYMPLGGRSIGAYGCDMYGPDYYELANEEVHLAIQIESKEGLENAEEILSVDGVDGTWVGPADLAASLELDLNTPEGREAHDASIMQVVAACKKTGKIPGIACNGKEQGEYRIEQGHLFVTPAVDRSSVSDSAKSIVEALSHLTV